MHFLATMTGQSLPNVLKLFSAKKVSGILKLKNDEFDGKILLKEGNVLFADSNQTMDFAESVKALNMISSDDLDKLKSAKGIDKIDKYLVDKGILQAKVATYIYSHQIAQTLYSMLELDKAEYKLNEGMTIEYCNHDYLPNTYNWLVEIYQNMYSWIELRQKVPKNIKKIKQKPLKNKDLSKEEQKLYNLCESKNKFSEIILWSSTTYFKAVSNIASLTENGLLEFESSGQSLSKKSLAEVVKVLDSMGGMPGIKSTFLLNKSGKMIAKGSNVDENDDNQAMAAIFSRSVSDFENNLKNDENEDNELIEQLLVERNNGDKTLLVVAGQIILVIEAKNDCDWGLLRLSAKRSIKSIKQLVGILN